MSPKRTILGVMLAAVLGLLVLALPSMAAAKDHNHDRIPDRWERNHGLSLKVNQAQRDQDRDQLVNRKEFEAGLDPNDADSDDDGVEDSDEGAGTITAFDTESGLLTINDLVGGSVTAKVTTDTEVECDNGDDNGDEDNDGQGGEDDQGGTGDDDAGDDDSGGNDKAAGVTSGDDDPVGDDEGDDDEEGDDGHDCSVDDLAVGDMVQEAELELTSDGFVWEEIELLK
jgi:hypothetical protein